MVVNWHLSIYPYPGHVCGGFLSSKAMARPGIQGTMTTSEKNCSRKSDDRTRRRKDSNKNRQKGLVIAILLALLTAHSTSETNGRRCFKSMIKGMPAVTWDQGLIVKEKETTWAEMIEDNTALELGFLDHSAGPLHPRGLRSIS